MKPLTPLQQRFVDEYLIDQNATQAYKRAGYKVKSDNVAHACAQKLLRNATVSAKITVGLAELAKGVRMTAADAWREISFLARSNIADIMDFTGVDLRLKPANGIPESAQRAIKSVKVKRHMEGAGESAREVEVTEFTVHDKLAALVSILKGHGELKEKHEHSGPDGGDIPIVVEFSRAATRPVEPAGGPAGPAQGAG